MNKFSGSINNVGQAEFRDLSLESIVSAIRVTYETILETNKLDPMNYHPEITHEYDIESQSYRIVITAVEDIK